MASYNSTSALPFISAAALTVYRFGILNGSAKLAHVGTAGLRADCIIAESVGAADLAVAGVVEGCIAKVEAGAAIALGANISSNASGQAITATTGHNIMGKALEAASGANSVISILFGHKGTA